MIRLIKLPPYLKVKKAWVLVDLVNKSLSMSKSDLKTVINKGKSKQYLATCQKIKTTASYGGENNEHQKEDQDRNLLTAVFINLKRKK